MYVPSPFAEPDPARAHAVIASNPFGALVVADGASLEIAHVPFLLDPAPPLGVLRVHVARANPIASLAADRRVVAVFQGAHAYVSPRWYEAPARNVPTWNYLAVHAHGVARRVDDRDLVLRALADLTAAHERDARVPWSLDAADRATIEGLANGIVVFSIAIDRLEAKAKMSQNRSETDRRRVIDGLRARRGPGDEDVAREIEERLARET